MSEDPSGSSPLATPAATEPAEKPSAAKAPAATFTSEEIKSAYNAFKKRWKLTRLDQESRIGRNPMSSGQSSSIAGIVPPDQFPRAIWDELVKQGRLKYAGQGFYSMP
jgi:hypothetical protein